LAAAPKAGKSTLLAHLLRAMADGVRFWDCAVERPSAVLWFTEERKALARRLSALGIPEDARAAAWRVRVTRRAADWQDVERELEMAPQGALVILDTGSRFWRVEDENDAAQVDEEVVDLHVLFSFVSG